MVNKTNKTFLLSATECELLTMTDEEIIQEVIHRFEDLQVAADSNSISEKTRKEMDERLCHCGILFAEGRRLATVYPELGRKLIVASVFWNEQRGLCYFTPSERKSLVNRITNLHIQESEDMKTQKKTKDEIIAAFLKSIQRLGYFTSNEHKPLVEYLGELSKQDEREWMNK